MSTITIQHGNFKLSEIQTLDIQQLNIEKGENWAFIGANGSGKSSLARVLSMSPLSGVKNTIHLSCSSII